MSKSKKSVIEVQGVVVSVQTGPTSDYLSLTDIAKFKNADHSDDVIRNWLRNRNTVEFLGVWERLNNPQFNPVEFDGIRIQTGLNSFTLTPKQWIEKTGAIGIRSQAGRYGGTFAHKDIAFEFASWVSVEFKLISTKIPWKQKIRRDQVSTSTISGSDGNQRGAGSKAESARVSISDTSLVFVTRFLLGLSLPSAAQSVRNPNEN